MKIALVLTSNLYKRNYIDSGVVKHLESQNDLQIFTTKDFTFEINSSKFFYVSSLVRYLLSLFSDLRTYVFSNKSKSFKYRIVRKKKSKVFSKLIRHYLFFILSRLPGAYFTIKLFVDLLLNVYNFFRKDELGEYDVILIPNSGFDPDADFIVNRANYLGIKSVLLIDNWDNLSSKSIIYFKPTRIFVMSEQSAEFAVSIHNLKRETISIIGTPRFEVYRDTPKVLFDFKYILFAGGSLPFDELAFIDRLKTFCHNHRLKVIYRPHPWRQKHNVKYFETIDRMDHVVLDPQIKGVDISSGNLIFQPDLSYYNSLIKGAQFVITPLSTFILEALICERKVIVIIEDLVESDELTSPYKVFMNYEHFKGIENLNKLFLKSDEENLDDLLKLVFTDNLLPKLNKLDLDYYVKFSEKKYCDLLTDSLCF